MADTLITRLSGVEGTIVRPLSAVRRYVNPEQDVLAAGRELQVETVLDGSISQVGDRIRVNVKLLRVGDGKQLWDGTFDESFTDIFSVQDRVSERVAGVLVARLNGRWEEIVHKRDTTNTEAYRLYLTGRYLWGKRTGDGFRQSIERYQEALKLDPNYALAYAGLADSYNFLGSAGEMRMNESHPLARAAATQALQLDDQLAEAHTSLAANIMDYYWDWPEAERHFQRAIDLNPNYPTVHHLYSQYLSIMGRLADSVAEAEKASALDPLSLAETENVALALYRARRYAEAITLSQQVIKMDGDFVPAHIQLGLSYTQTGSYDASITELRKALELSHNNPDILGMVGYAYAAAGRRNEAREVLGELKELANKQYVSPFDNAGVLVGLGEKDEAFTWLNKACDERVWIMGFIKVEPVFDSLRSDQRYTELVRRIGLSVS
jgi:tetratricopeptide (TPR) repeat protein